MKINKRFFTFMGQATLISLTSIPLLANAREVSPAVPILIKKIIKTQPPVIVKVNGNGNGTATGTCNTTDTLETCAANNQIALDDCTRWRFFCTDAGSGNFEWLAECTLLNPSIASTNPIFCYDNQSNSARVLSQSTFNEVCAELGAAEAETVPQDPMVSGNKE